METIINSNKINAVDFSKLIFPTIGGEFEVFFPEEYDTCNSPAVIEYATTRGKAIEILKEHMLLHYPTFKYICI